MSVDTLSESQRTAGGQQPGGQREDAGDAAKAQRERADGTAGRENERGEPAEQTETTTSTREDGGRVPERKTPDSGGDSGEGNLKPDAGGGDGANAGKVSGTGTMADNENGGDDATGQRAKRRRPTVGIGDKAWVDYLSMVTGEGNLIYNVFQGLDEARRATARTPLLELTRPLPEQPPPTGHFTPAEVEPRCRVLLSERLLLVSCHDMVIARAAAHELADASGVPGERVRLLEFEQVAADDAQVTIHDLLEAPYSEEENLLVVVDGVGQAARRFVDSLVRPLGVYWPTVLKQRLAEKRLLVLCLTEPQSWGVRGSHDEFPLATWPIAFLEHLLRDAFPGEHETMTRVILRQREEGRWSRDDQEFCHEVRRAVRRKELEARVKDGGQPAAAGHEYPLGRRQPVHTAALYAAAYLPGLGPAEFDRVVTALLGEDTVPLPPPATTGGQQEPQAPVQKRLAEVWRESADQVMDECHLTTVRDPSAGVMVEFVETGAGESVRGTFESAHTFYLNGRFRALHEAGLLFSGSEAAASRVVGLTVEMAATYPESYGTEWVVQQLAHEGVLTSGAETRRVRRAAELLRALGEHDATRPLVDAVLGRLLSGGAPTTVLRLTRRLRFAPTFDAFRWMRQLIDQAPEEVRRETYRLLYRELMVMDLEIYAVLHAVATWLPPADQPAERHSPSARLALRLLLEYAADRTERVDVADYGAWPSRHPLLAVTTPEALTNDLSLLTRWLFHPAMQEAVELDEPHGEQVLQHVLAMLLMEWAFILFGPTGLPADSPHPSRPPDTAPDAASSVDADAVLAALLRGVIDATADTRGRATRRALLAVWENVKEAVTSFIPLVDRTQRALRDELLWKRQVLRALLLRFRALQQGSPDSSRVVETFVQGG
jgi:hypothetical protein